jgi:hypothetical protein
MMHLHIPEDKLARSGINEERVTPYPHMTHSCMKIRVHNPLYLPCAFDDNNPANVEHFERRVGVLCNCDM